MSELDVRRKVPRRAYGRRHQVVREKLVPVVRAGGVRCARCGREIQPDEEWDLGHVDGHPELYAGPEHLACNRATSGRDRWQPIVEDEPERDGLDRSDDRWDVPWLKGLRRVPRNAVWPRLMTVPHPRAVGSLGREFIRWAESRSGPLRWWQRLVAVRLLEVDAAGELVWEAAILSLARQVGKSWLLREIALWRIHQGGRFGEPQLVLNTGSSLPVIREVQRPARAWAKSQRELYAVREVNGQEEIELVVDQSRWMLRAKEATYGYSASLAMVDEGWKVRPASVEEGLVPTMVERIQAQLLLVSTAHRLATALMIGRRGEALEHLEDGTGDLLLEWSVPRDRALDVPESWRLASPHWTPRRERLISRRCEAAHNGVSDDPEEPDPIESFRAQWLNQWPTKKIEPPGKVSSLLAPGMWEALAVPNLWSDSPVYVAIEDDYGRGAAVAVAVVHDDGHIEVDGWERPDWDSAMVDVQRLAGDRRIKELHVGASLLDRVPGEGLPKPKPAVGRQTRTGLALVRDLAASGMLVHDVSTDELDSAVAVAKVKETLTGLYLIQVGPTHLLRALAWVVQVAHKPARSPAVH